MTIFDDETTAIANDDNDKCEYVYEGATIDAKRTDRRARDPCCGRSLARFFFCTPKEMARHRGRAYAFVSHHIYTESHFLLFSLCLSLRVYVRTSICAYKNMCVRV